LVSTWYSKPDTYTNRNSYTYAYNYSVANRNAYSHANRNPTPTSNLILNPSLEEGETSPHDWLSSAWGTNTTIFTYPAPGLDGAKGAKVEMTAYTDGDAKWYFQDVNVTPGSFYEFTHMYQSNVITPITPDLHYPMGHINTRIWSQQLCHVLAVTVKRTFQAPTNSVSVTLLHVLASIGSLTVDNYQLKEIADPTKFPRNGFTKL